MRRRGRGGFLAVGLTTLTTLGAPVVMATPAAAGSCTYTIDDVIVTEGDSGTTNAVFTVTRNFGGSGTVDFATADNTAQAGSDYTAQSGTATLTSSATATITVPVIGDTGLEGDETFFVNLSNATGGCLIADNQGVGTITNDDTGIPTGYRLTALDGGVFAYGQSTYEGSASMLPDLNAPIIDIDETPDRSGYWQAGLDGGVFAWNAPFFGSAGGLPLVEPVIAMAARPQGDGYWLVALDGGVFAYGQAPYLGNATGIPGALIVDIIPTSTGNGYWLLDANGTVYAFGDATNFGNHQVADVEAVGMARTADNMGYWITNLVGGVFEFGTAADKGEITNPENLNGSIVGIEALATGNGFWLLGLDGGVFAFNAPFYGSAGSLPLVAPVVAMAGLA